MCESYFQFLFVLCVSTFVIYFQAKEFANIPQENWEYDDYRKQSPRYSFSGKRTRELGGGVYQKARPLFLGTCNGRKTYSFKFSAKVMK